MFYQQLLFLLLLYLLTEREINDLNLEKRHTAEADAFLASLASCP